MKRWGYVQYNGEHFRLSWLHGSDIEDFLDDPDEYAGIERFVGEESLSKEATRNGWAHSDAMLVEVEVIMPKEKTKAWKLEARG